MEWSVHRIDVNTNVYQLTIANKPWTGDFDAMPDRRFTRFLVPCSRARYFDIGRERLAEHLHATSDAISISNADPLGERPSRPMIWQR